MNTYHLTLSSPDGNFFDGDVYCLSVRGLEGELAVMAGHIPFITTVKSGEFTIQLEDGTEKTAENSGGLLTVTDTGTTFLSGKFSWK